MRNSIKRHFKLSYTCNGIKWFEEEAESFPQFYKNFWQMVQDEWLMKKSKRPIQIVDIYENVGGHWQPHSLSQYTDEELLINAR